jgi:hypothetical protein
MHRQGHGVPVLWSQDFIRGIGISAPFRVIPPLARSAHFFDDMPLSPFLESGKNSFAGARKQL